MGRPTKAESERRKAASTVAITPEQTSIPGIEPEISEVPKVQPYTPTGDGGTGEKTKQRFSLTLNEKGRPDVSSMRDATKEQFRAFMRDPELRNELGLTADAPPPVITEETIKFFYSMLGPVQAYAFALALKCPVDLASKVFTYTPEEIEQLTPPTLALANKYSAYLTAYTKWQEEINFGLTFVMVTQAKLAHLRKEISLLAIDAKIRRDQNPALQDHIRIVDVPSDAPPPPVPAEGFAVAGAGE